MNEEAIDVAKSVTQIMLLIMSLFSFVIGACGGDGSLCEYDSILSRINIPYVVGCELTRPRFKKENKQYEKKN